MLIDRLVAALATSTLSSAAGLAGFALVRILGGPPPSWEEAPLFVAGLVLSLVFAVLFGGFFGAIGVAPVAVLLLLIGAWIAERHPSHRVTVSILAGVSAGLLTAAGFAAHPSGLTVLNIQDATWPRDGDFLQHMRVGEWVYFGLLGAAGGAAFARFTDPSRA